MEGGPENVVRARALSRLWLDAVGQTLGDGAPEQATHYFGQALEKSTQMPQSNVGEAIMSLVFALQTTSLAFRSLLDMIGSDDKDVASRLRADITDSFGRAIDSALPQPAQETDESQPQK